MRRIFLLATLVFVMMMSVAFAEEEAVEEPSAGYEYTSQFYGFKITCPAEPKVVVNPYPDVSQRGELLIFAVTPDGQDVAYGYMIQFEAFEISAKATERKNSQVVYIKDGEKIADALNVMEAGLSFMDYENVRIYKGVMNSVNRRVNCETANIGKTVSAAVMTP